MEKKSLYIIVAIVVVIGAAVLLFGRPSQSYPSVQTPTNAPNTQVPANTPTIVKAVVSRSIDAKGNATGMATTFSAKTDKIVYAVLTLKNVTKNTKLSYVRYLDGKYVDSKVAQPTQDDITNFYFAFEKGIGDYPKGTYTLNLYVNGGRSQTLNYVFK